MKGIKNPNSIMNYSYAHSVLQSLSCLDCINIFLNYTNTVNLKSSPNFALTNALYDLFSDLHSGKEGNSQNIICSFINSYNNNASIIKTNKVLSQDPFYFLYFLLQFLHMENNMPLNNNYNLQNLCSQNLQNQQNDEYMFNLFKDFWNQTQNSMISNYFFNIERNVYNCLNCKVYFSYGMKSIFTIKTDIAEFYRNSTNLSKCGTNIDLYDCLKSYCGGCKKNCKFCGNQNIGKYNKFIIPACVLIISFERKKHTFKRDVDFNINININEYISKSRTADFNINSNYILKACISYYQPGKYIADCYLNNIGKWCRFMDNEVIMLNNVSEIYDYEPQILIYELNQQNNNNNFNFNNHNNININQITDPFKLMNNNNLNQLNNNNNLDNNQFNQNIINAQNQNSNIFQSIFQFAN